MTEMMSIDDDEPCVLTSCGPTILAAAQATEEDKDNVPFYCDGEDTCSCLICNPELYFRYFGYLEQEYDYLSMALLLRNYNHAPIQQAFEAITKLCTIKNALEGKNGDDNRKVVALKDIVLIANKSSWEDCVTFEPGPATSSSDQLVPNSPCPPLSKVQSRMMAEVDRTFSFYEHMLEEHTKDVEKQSRKWNITGIQPGATSMRGSVPISQECVTVYFQRKKILGLMSVLKDKQLAPMMLQVEKRLKMLEKIIYSEDYNHKPESEQVVLMTNYYKFKREKMELVRKMYEKYCETL